MSRSFFSNQFKSIATFSVIPACRESFVNKDPGQANSRPDGAAGMTREKTGITNADDIY